MEPRFDVFDCTSIYMSVKIGRLTVKAKSFKVYLKVESMSLANTTTSTTLMVSSFVLPWRYRPMRGALVSSISSRLVPISCAVALHLWVFSRHQAKSRSISSSCWVCFSLNFLLTLWQCDLPSVISHTLDFICHHVYIPILPPVRPPPTIFTNLSQKRVQVSDPLRTWWGFYREDTSYGE